MENNVEYLGPLEPQKNGIEYLGPLEEQPSIGQKVSSGIQFLKDYYDYLHTETEKPVSFKDFIKRVVPESISKTAVGAVEFVPTLMKNIMGGYESAAKRLVSPEGDISTKLYEAGEIATKPIIETAKGLGEFVGGPLGLQGLEEAKKRWTTDPVGSALAITPIIKGGLTARQRIKMRVREAIDETVNKKIQEAIAEKGTEIPPVAENVKVEKSVLTGEPSPIEEVKYLGPLEEPTSISTSKYFPEIKDLREQVNIGEPGKRTLTPSGEPIVTQSTYPSWMQDKGWTKNEVLNAIDKGLAGDKLGVRQQEIFNIVKNEGRNQFAEQVKIAQEAKIQPIKTGDLEVGDRIRVKGETLKVTEKTDEAITIKDGQEFKLDPYFDTIEGKRVTPAKSKEVKGEGLSKLAEEQKQINQAGKIIIDLGKRDTKPIYSFPTDNEFPYQSAKGIKPEGVIQRLKSIATEVGHKFSRTYEHLPNKPENSQLIFDLKKLEKQKDVVADRTTRNIGEVLSGLNKEDYNLFNRKIILDDLASDVNRGLYQGDKKLPFNFTPESLIQEKSKLDALISTNPKVIEALGKRDAFWEQQIKPEYIEALSPYKIGVEDMFKENYYRHQVLDYVGENGIFGTGKRLKTPNKGYMKGRVGASNLYNTDFLEAEHNIMAQMLHDAETAKTLTKIKNAEDIAPVVRNKAKNEGLKNWHDAIPEGYVVWQPKEGSVFHPVLTIEERTAQKILEGNIDSILGDEGKFFKEALAVGGKRKEWVVRQEVADTLNNLVRERSKGIISSADLGIITAWKKWQLVSPRRFFKYNMRNLTGDAEAVFLGNMSGFKKVPQAVQELSQTFFGKKPMTPDMANWFERGGMSSTLQAQEMDTLKGTWMFSRLHEKPDLNIWNKYWKTARLTTDFRESILRYANFLNFKEQLIKNGGKPLNYGASKPEMIDGLKDVNDKAYWLSNDLLGAYDRVSVAGQTLRERVMPFWSWQEVNFKRYIQLMKNASNNTELATKIGIKLGATTARTAIKIGGFAIKAAAFSSALAVYNHTFFPDEEKQLSPDLRATPHIIIGRDKQGNIQYFSRMGTLDDFISWFGLDAAPKLITEYLNGKKTFKEMLSEQAKESYQAPINKVVQGGEPFLKLAAETAFRKSSFPDIFKAGTIRDRWLHIARSFGLENEYIAMVGKPSKGYGESLKGLFVYTISPGESAYRQVYDMKSEFMKKLGRTSEGFWLTPTGDALYNMKLAIKYDDKKAFTKYFTEYVSIAQKQGKTPNQIRQGIKTSIQAMNPLYGMDDKTKRAFVVSLNKDDQDTLAEAIQFYNDILLGKQNKEGD